jgi:Ankyrin repeat
VTALHLAAQSGKRPAVAALLELRADPTLRDERHGGDPAGWAEFSCHAELAALLRARGRARASS